MEKQANAKIVIGQTTWLWRGLAAVLVGAGSSFFYAGLPSQLILLAIGVCLMVVGIFLILTR
jgi:hypothetical protein